MRVYFAAPLDSAKCRDTNNRLVKDLRRLGFEVYVPHEHGVGDVLLEGLQGEEYWKKRKELWKRLYEQDMVGLKTCDIVVAISTKEDKHLSAGLIWELGWASGNGKVTLLCTQGAEETMDYSLMVMNSVDKWFKEWNELLTWIKGVSE